MLLIIDNYDSFTFNVVQVLGTLYPDIKVVKNDEITVDAIEAMQPQAIVLSPGPGTPDRAGICLDVVSRYAGTIPILGICLGHQTIAQAFGGKIIKANKPMHGKASDICIDTDHPLFYGLPDHIQAARYHSLIADRPSFPDQLRIIAEDKDGQIMALAHRELPVCGVQFHPESILAEHGIEIFRNFLIRIAGISPDELPAVPVQNALRPYLRKLTAGGKLDPTELKEAADVLRTHQASEVQAAALMTALKMQHIDLIDEQLADDPYIAGLLAQIE